MKVEILDIDRLIEVNKLQEVTSKNLFSNKMLFDPDGILSNDIFGVSKTDRRNTFAYIRLHRKFLHPHIYQKILKQSMCTMIDYIISGQRRYVVKNGELVDNPNGWTGLEGLYNHWDEIDWKKKKSANTLAKDVISKLNKDQIFIDKILVTPPAYRDVMIAGTIDSSDHVNEVNDLYVRLLRSVALISEGGLFARTQYATQKKIQDNIVEIFTYYKRLISRKQGLIKKNLIGKSVDYGVRAVISAPTYEHDHFEDNMVDLEHTAVPMSQCCSLFYKFIESWIMNFFTREVINDTNSITYYDIQQRKEVPMKIKDIEVQFSEKKVKKLINDYVFNPDNRYKVIVIDGVTNDNRICKAYMTLKGKVLFDNNTAKSLQRPLTVTDLIYLACVETCEKRHVMVSRYPVGTDKGIFFSKIRVQSTANHIHLVFNGVEYPYYPDIDLKTPAELVGTTFIDTLVMSNAHLDGMGADYVNPLWSAMMVTSYKNKLVNAQQAV